MSTTVEDAILFVQGIGERFLWIDRLCIIQDDMRNKQAAINKMDAIFFNAYAVIIAGSGSNADSGLPGIDQDTRSHQEISSELKASVDTIESLHNTTYDTRAWTYQERYIANRKIAFLKELVIFQCQVDTFREDIIHLNPAILVDLQYRREYSLGFSPKNFGTPNAEYKKAVETYSGRILSYQSDILNAFAGISRHLGNSLGAKQLIFGIPMYEKDIIPARYLGWKHRAS